MDWFFVYDSKMPFHLMVYIRIVLTTLVTITCLLGDNFVELTEHPVLRALVDNGTHAVIGAITGIAFVVQFYEKITNCLGWSLIILCFSTSSLIDLDHFIQARSWNLEVSIFLQFYFRFHDILNCRTQPTSWDVLSSTARPFQWCFSQSSYGLLVSTTSRQVCGSVRWYALSSHITPGMRSAEDTGCAPMDTLTLFLISTTSCWP